MSDTETARRLSDQVRELDPEGAHERLDGLSDVEIAHTLTELGPGHAIEILEKFGAERRGQIAAATQSGEGEQWLRDWHYPEGSVGRLMETTPAVFLPETPVTTVIEAMRAVVRKQLITYI